VTGRKAAGLLLISCLAGRAEAQPRRLAFVDVVRNGVGGAEGLGGPVAMALSPDGAHAYVASGRDGALAVLRRDARTGRLSFIEDQVNGVGGVDGLGTPAGPRAVDVSPDGRHVYVAAAEGAVAVFGRDASTGTLAFVEAKRDGIDGVAGLNGAWSVAVSPDGRHLYTASFADQAVAVFARNATTGALTFVETQVNGIGGVVGLEDP
jgi:DNA-binding beta-propeller fold protein YncE